MSRQSSTLDSYIRAAAATLSESKTPLLDARVLAKHAFGMDDAALILAGPRVVTNAECASLDALITRRAAGEPVSQIIGEKEFFGLTFEIAPGVLTPRPDSETLIAAAMRRRDSGAPLTILDLGTGSGALLCVLLSVFPKARGVGVDISEEAVLLACRNAAALGLNDRAGFVIGDWTAPLGRSFDLIVANPPYIAEGDRAGLDADVRDFEDSRALFAGPEGLDAYRAILNAAPALLAPQGLMILELGEGQETPVRALARAAFPLAAMGTAADLAGRARALLIDLGPQKKV